MLCRGALRDARRRTPTPVAAQGVLLLRGVSANEFGSLLTDGLSAGQRMVFKDLVKNISRGTAHITMLRSQSHRLPNGPVRRPVLRSFVGWCVT